MRLNKGQKELVLKWIAEGLQTDEVNKRAQEYDPPFRVSRQQVWHYRESRQVEIDTIVAADQEDALKEGLALAAERVRKLKQIAALLENDILGGFLWLDQVKGVGTGPIAEIVEYQEFNRAEIEAYRGVLDDIAKEVGGRVARSDLTSDGKALKIVIEYADVDPDIA